MKDTTGREIEVGDTIVHATRRGSYMDLSERVVLEVHPHHIVAVKPGENPHKTFVYDSTGKVPNHFVPGPWRKSYIYRTSSYSAIVKKAGE